MRWRSGSVFFLAVDGRGMDIGAGGRKGDDSGVIAMSWARVEALGVLPGVCGGRMEVMSSVFVVLPASCRRASYGEG